MRRVLLTIIILGFLVSLTYGFESFTIETEAKAYKKVTIEYYAQDYEQVHDSTVTMWYDKDGVEIHRKVVKGCSNRKNDWTWEGIDSLDIGIMGIWNLINTEAIDTLYFDDDIGIVLDSVVYDPEDFMEFY